MKSRADGGVGVVRRAREAISREFGNDPAKLVSHYMELQRNFTGRIVPKAEEPPNALSALTSVRLCSTLLRVPTRPPTHPTEALSWAQEAIGSSPRRCIVDTHAYRRLRERRISDRSLWAAIRNATSCVPYVPERGPLAGGTSWRITGPDDDGEMTAVGVETFLDQRWGRPPNPRSGLITWAAGFW